MKNWLRNLIIAGSLLIGIKGISQNTDAEFIKHLSDSNNWKNYELNEGHKAPVYNPGDSVEKERTLKINDFKIEGNKNGDIYNTKEKSFVESDGTYLVIKQIRPNSEYSVSGKSPNYNFAREKAVAMFRHFLKYEIGEEQLEKVDNGDKILDSQEILNLEKLILKKE